MLTKLGINPICEGERGSQVIGCYWCFPGKAKPPGGFQSRDDSCRGKQSGLGGQKILVLIWTEAWS